MSVWSALLLFRFVLNRLDAKKKTDCCIFTLIVTNITKNRNVLQNYIFLVGLNCVPTFALSTLKQKQNEKQINQHALFNIILRGGRLVIYCIIIFRIINQPYYFLIMNTPNINSVLQDVANLLLEHEQEQRETILFEELDRLIIYRSNCWDIINEERPIDFYNDTTGENATTPEQLAWAILYEKFMDEYSTLIY